MEQWSQFVSELLTKSGVAYLWFVLLAVWGGTASYLSRMRKKNLPFSIAELVGECTISGFAGIVSALICVEWGASIEITAAAAGVAGHMGGRGVYLVEEMLVEKFRAAASKS